MPPRRDYATNSNVPHSLAIITLYEDVNLKVECGNLRLFFSGQATAARHVQQQASRRRVSSSLHDGGCVQRGENTRASEHVRTIAGDYCRKKKTETSSRRQQMTALDDGGEDGHGRRNEVLPKGSKNTRERSLDKRDGRVTNQQASQPSRAVRLFSVRSAGRAIVGELAR